MDKLEKALEKARKLRTGEPFRPATPAYARPAHENDSSTPGVSGTAVISKSHLERCRVIAHRNRSKKADVFRILRTRILQTMAESDLRTLAITSPNYGEGKTTIALNLAVSIALDLKQTVLLVDLDLRKPSIAEFLGISIEAGLSDYLLHDRPIPECLLRTNFDRLAILPAGRVVDNSSEVLASPKMAWLAQELKTRYDDRIIIYDMPPILAQDDPIAFLPHIDAVLVVADEGATKTSDIKRVMSLLTDANVIGCVLNHTGGKKLDVLRWIHALKTAIGAHVSRFRHR